MQYSVYRCVCVLMEDPFLAVISASSSSSSSPCGSLLLCFSEKI